MAAEWKLPEGWSVKLAKDGRLIKAGISLGMGGLIFQKCDRWLVTIRKGLCCAFPQTDTKWVSHWSKSQSLSYGAGCHGPCFAFMHVLPWCS